MTGFIKSKLLAVALLVAPALAVADAPERTMHADAARVDYYAKMTIIAERDLNTAQRVIEMARTQREIAVRDRNSKAAAYWSKRHQQALADESKASDEISRFRAERDRARADFEASADAVRTRRPG